jgi:probable F420-dependent oxidoreductase
VMVLPGRHPVLVAKQLATLARLAPRRILPVFGLRPALRPERPYFPVPDGKRAAVFDEALTLTRMLLQQPSVTFAGEFFSVDGAGVGFTPEHPLDIWLGGSAPAALRRVGRLADGWLASFITPDQAAAGIDVIRAAATEAGRAVDDEHYGISLPVAFGDIPDRLLAAIRERHPDRDPAELVPFGWDAAEAVIADFVTAGVSKFVVRPATTPTSWPQYVTEFADRLIPLQT